MPNCSTCTLFELESDEEDCLHVNRPGGLDLTRKVIEACRLPIGSSVLDAACGTGTTLDFLRNEMNLIAVGIDFSRAMLLKSMQQHREINGIQASCLDLPLPDAAMDGVMMECALSLAGEMPRSLAEFKRVLRPEGFLILTDIYVRELNDPRGLDCLPASSCLAGARTEAFLRGQIEEAGFTISVWQDETALFKAWLARMIFKLGSLAAVYRRMVSCDQDARCMADGLGSAIKLGYYSMIAQKL